MMELREFTKNDWYGYAGAERFSDGSQPLIGRYGIVEIVVDANGIGVLVDDTKETEYGGWYMSSYDKKYSLDVAKSIAEWIVGKTKKQIVGYLNEILDSPL
jgi:hypothetical protein